MSLNLTEIAREYPSGLVSAQLADIDRVAFELGLIAEGFRGTGTLVDLGGGIGLFPIACAASGHRVTLIDDFRDPINEEFRCPLDVHTSHGVTVLSKNLTVDPALPMDDNSVDVVTTFDSIEHWHNSPRFALLEAIRVLRPGGLFVVGVPNSVNLRKRVTVPLGKSNWSHFDDWYRPATFRGHVREFTVQDLHRLAADLGLADTRILGRNWIAFASPRRWVKVLAPYIDRPLRLQPSLCSDLYLVGRKDPASVVS